MSKTLMDRIDGLEAAELVTLAGTDLSPGDDLDEAGYLLAMETSDTIGLGTQNVWEQLKREFHALICTDDARYASLREQAGAFSQKNTTAFVSLVSAGVGAAIGLSAVALVPLVGLLLLALVRIGKETFCHLPG